MHVDGFINGLHLLKYKLPGIFKLNLQPFFKKISITKNVTKSKKLV
jgi:hypothetical protein